MKILKKVISIVLVLVLALCIFSGCKKEEKLIIWAGGQWTGTDLQNLKAFIDEYNSNNSLGMTIEVVPKTDMETALATAVRNNKVPDILIWDRFNTPTYAETQALFDISSYIERDNIDINLFNDEAMTELYYDGKYYGLPLDLDVWGIYVNTDMVDDYNATHADQIVLNDNWTWDEMYDIASKLVKYEDNKMTVAGYSGHVMHQHLFKYLCSTSQDFLTPDGKPNFDNKQTRDILSFFGKMGGNNNGIWENGLVEKSNFTSGQLAMIDQSLYFTDYIERYNSEMNYQFMPQPRYSVDGVAQQGAINGGMLGGFGIAFPKPSPRFMNKEFYEKFEIAWSFAKDWLLSESMQTSWSQKTGTLPALKSLYTNPLVLENVTLSRAASFVDNYRIRPQIPGYLTMQTQVVDTCIKAYTEGAASLETTINSLITGCKQYMD